MKFFEHIKKGFLYSHVYFFIVVIILVVVLLVISLFFFQQYLEIFIPILVFLMLWFILMIFIWVTVSFILAYQTKNPRYIMQFIGIVLFLVYPFTLFYTVLAALGVIGVEVHSFPPDGPIGEFIYMAFPIGILITILGYYGPYQGKPLRYSRNIIVREGSKITDMTNGYSKRPFSKYFKEIENLDRFQFQKISKRFGKHLATQGLILDWKLYDNKLEIVPMKQLIADPDFFITNFKQVWDFIFRKKHMSKITINKNGNVMAVISEKDYNYIKAPVAYHTLCENVVDIFAKAFIEYSKGNYYGYDRVFLYGPNISLEPPANFSYPKYLKWDPEDRNTALLFIAFFSAAAMTGYAMNDFMPNSPFYKDCIIPFNTIFIICLTISLILIEWRIRKVKY